MKFVSKFVKIRERKVMVFGVFDGLHPGHFYFLRQAKKYGKKLIAVVARDSAVFKLKKRKPLESERKRLVAMTRAEGAFLAILGDKKQSVYSAVKRYKPDVVCFGYDQRALYQDIKQKIKSGYLPEIKLVRIKSYKPHKFHSSLV